MLSRILSRGEWGMGGALHVLTGVVVLLRAFPVLLAETVYFDSYGHCITPEFDLDDDHYTVKAVGDKTIHETLICDMTFKSPPSTGVCLTFKEFRITDCGVTLLIYQQSTPSGRQWKRLTCEDEMPAQMCTPERYVTIKLVKRKLNNNKLYEFDILIEKSTNMTGENVILASSIGLFVGIIAGVVALIAVLSVIVLCCCCKPCKSHPAPPGYTATPAPDIRLYPPSTASHFSVEPSAPPVSEMGDEFTPLQQCPPLYPALPQSYPPGQSHAPHEQPPPYAPPPYEEHYPTKD